jgi:hypothetical protein
MASYDSTGSNLRWLEFTGGPDNDRGRGVGCDANGNVYFCGEFVDAVDFGNNHLIGDTLLDIFVTKFSPSGNTCSASASISSNLLCAGDCNGTAMVMANGQGPFSYLWTTIPVQTNAMATGLCAGTYEVTVTDGNGCVATSSIDVIPPPALQMSAVITDATCIGCHDGRIDVTVTGGTPGYNYLWNIGEITEDLSILYAGTYSECITDGNGCILCDTFTVLDPGTAIINPETDFSFSVFPNPTFDNTTIKVPIDAGVSRLVVYSSDGREFVNHYFKGSLFNLSTTDFPAGLYFIELVASDGKRSYQRLMKI